MSQTELEMLVCNNFNERQMMPSLNISFYIPNIPNLVYTSALLRAPPATSQKWLIISSRNIFSDAWRHLCSVWRDLEFWENVTRHNKLLCLVFSILQSPPILQVQVFFISSMRIYLPSIEADINQCVSPHQLTSTRALVGHSCQNVW